MMTGKLESLPARMGWVWAANLVLILEFSFDRHVTAGQGSGKTSLLSDVLCRMVLDAEASGKRDDPK